MKTVDLSNWDYPTFSASCLREAGVVRAILGCWDRAITSSMLVQLRQVGIAVQDLYVFIYPRLPWERRELNNALAIAQEHGGIRRIWMDWESQFTEWPGDMDTEAPGTTIAHRIAIAREVEAIIRDAGIQPGVYTGAYWWTSKMGNTDEFSHLPVWLADYGANDPDNPRPPRRTVAFGGWQYTSAHQYSSSIPVCGRERDHNYWFLQEDSPMTDDERELLLALATIAFGDPAGADLRTIRDALVVARRLRDQDTILLLGLQQTQERLGALEAMIGQGGDGQGPVAPHRHTATVQVELL